MNKIIKLRTLVVLQILFAVASVSYLLISLWIENETGEPLSAAPMGLSLSLFALYSLSLLLSSRQNKLMYRIAMGIAVVVFGGGGVLANILRYMDSGLDQYASFTTYVIAVSINIFGTIWNIIAGLGLFSSQTLNPK